MRNNLKMILNVKIYIFINSSPHLLKFQKQHIKFITCTDNRLNIMFLYFKKKKKHL